MAHYIPPHARGTWSPDKSELSLLSEDIFEPRVSQNLQNVTIRRPSVPNNIGFGNENVKQTEIATLSVNKEIPKTGLEIDLDSDTTTIDPQLLTVLKSIDSRLANQGATLDKLTVSQNVMQKSIDFGHANSSDLKDRIVTLEKENKKLLNQNKELESQGRDMTRRLDSIDQQLAQLDHNNKRRNILIDGVQESQGENTMDIALDIMLNLDKELKRDDIDFTQRIFRPGNKTKPILVVMKSVARRDSIMRNKKSLKSHKNLSKIWLNDDSNPMIRKQKLESRTVVRHAISKGFEAKQRGSGVVLNGRYYNRENLNQLPDEIKLSTTKTREDEHTVGFQGKHAPLSNMYPCKIVVDGKDHKSAEHYIQYTKVMLVNLTELAQKISDTPCPYTAKSIGGSVQIDIWNNVGEDVVKQAIRYKYQQNPHLKKILLATGTKTIIECTPDLKWGAGIALDSKLFGTGKYPGSNVTGHSLQEARVEFRDMEVQTKVTPLPAAAPHGERTQNQLIGTAEGVVTETESPHTAPTTLTIAQEATGTDITPETPGP